jgi:ribosomal protein L11 methyltransferase
VRTTTGGLWTARLTVPGGTATRLMQAIETELEPDALALTRFEHRGGAAWRIEAIYDSEPDTDTLRRRLAPIGAAKFPLAIRRLPQRNWLDEIQRQMPAVRAGRFFVHGSHVALKPPRGTIPFLVDAGLAFGTGHHETTRGCLLALDRLARRGFEFRRPLDLGCGTAVLAMAAARLWKVPVIAADTDPTAVTVARETVAENNLSGSIRCVRSDGYAGRAVHEGGPYDLVTANILAGPLIRLAPGLARHTGPGAVAILAGLLAPQADAIVAAHEAVGFDLVDQHLEGDWPVLVLQKKGKRRKAGKRKRRPQGKGRRLADRQETKN